MSNKAVCDGSGTLSTCNDHAVISDAGTGRSRDMHAAAANVIWFGGLALLVVAVLSAIGSGAIREFYFIADMMYLPTLYADLTQWSGRFSDWSLTPAPYLFPDLLLYAATRSLGLSVEWAHYSAGLVQMLAIVIGARATLRNAAPEMALQASFTAPGFAILFGILSSKIVPIASLFVISCHGGEALVALAVLALCMRPERRRSIDIAIAALSCLAAFSDPLFVVGVAIPALAFAAGLSLRKADCIPTAVQPTRRDRYLIASMSAFAGALLTRFANALTSARYLQPRPQRMASTLNELVKDALGPGRLEFGVLLATLLISVAVIVAGNRPSLTAARRLGVWTIASTACTVSSIVLAGRYNDGSFRYLIVPMVLGVTTVAALAGAALQRRGLMIAAAASVIATFGQQVISQRDHLLHGKYTSDVRETARCVADAAFREHSDTVLSDYWHAKPLMLMADGQIKVLQLDEQHLEPRAWINSRGWYRGDHQIAVVVANGLPLDEISKHFGSPTQTEHCQDLDLLVYRGPARVALRQTFQSDVAGFN